MSGIPGVGETLVRLRSGFERFRTSLFGLPAVWVVGAIVLARVVIAIDRRNQDADLPGWLASTVASSRALLGAITTGTITAASVVFSLTFVAVQLSSSSYSSRVVRTFLRDRFQQNVIGLVLGTFFYSVVVLTEIRGPLEEGGEPYVARLPVSVAIVLAFASLLGLLASINHTARQVRVASVARRVADEIAGAIDARYPDRVDVQDVVLDTPRAIVPPRARGDMASDAVGAVVTADRSGWVQQISVDAIADAASDASVRLDVAVGTYVMADSPLLTVSRAPTTGVADQRSRLHGAFAIGDERTMQQDVGLGLMMFEDIAVRALSPGINDPNTARMIIVQLGEALLDLFGRDLGRGVVVRGSTQIELPVEPDHEDYCRAAFDQIGAFARDQPVVLTTLVRTIDEVARELHRRRERTQPVSRALAAQLERIRREVELGTMPEAARNQVLADIDGLVDSLDPDSDG